MPPRTLNAQVGVWFSCFTHTSHPVRLARSVQAYCGVGGTVRCTSWAAASNSARLNNGLGALIFVHLSQWRSCLSDHGPLAWLSFPPLQCATQAFLTRPSARATAWLEQTR